MTNFVPLAKIATINPQLPKNVDEFQDVSFIAMASVSEDGKILTQETRKLRDTKKGYTYFQRGDVLLAKITPCFENGKAALASNLEHPIGFGSTEFHVLRPIPQQLDAQYLFYMVWSDRFRFLGQKAMKGAAGQKRVPPDFLKSFEIPLPALDDQKRIAYLLSKVERLIGERRSHLQQLDDLLKSVFLEMFGDPVRNEKGWEKTELEQFGKISTGNTPPRKDPSNYSSKYIEWIKTDNISADSVFISQAVEYLSETGAINARIVKKDALLVACIAGSVESIGRSALTNRTVAFNQQINAIQPNQNVNPFYLYTLFKLSKSYIQSHASKGMKKILTKGDFEKIMMIKPPIELQNQFATVAEKVETIKYHYQQSLTDLEILYGALSQKAFKGELDLSKIPLIPESAEMTTDKNMEPKDPQPAPETVNLPVPSDLTVLNTTVGRQALLEEWLNVWLEHLNNEPFSPQPFLDAAQKRLSKLTEDNPVDWELGLADYEQINDWLIKSLNDGKLEQIYENAKKQVQVKAVHP